MNNSSSTIQPLRSSLLSDAGFKHAFFSREGGVSSGVFDSLNFATGSGDSPENLKTNLKRVGAELGVSGEQIYFLTQVHGVDHYLADGEESQAAVLAKEGDIVLTQKADIAAAIRTADCVPVLLACRKTGWVAACHSGWQGCEKGAAIQAVSDLRSQGATDLIAAIGPHISAASFEVDEDVAERLTAASPEKDIVDRTGERPHVDLRKMVRSQLLSAGLLNADIDDVAGCTVIEEERYFSFRRDKNPSGRLLSAIVGKK